MNVIKLLNYTMLLYSSFSLDDNKKSPEDRDVVRKNIQLNTTSPDIKNGSIKGYTVNVISLAEIGDGLENNNLNTSQTDEEHELYLKKLKNAYIGLYIACPVFFVLSIPFWLGFKTGGVSGGSPASCIQSGIGNVVAGSLFAICQCIGTTLLGTPLSTFLFVATGISSIVIFTVHHFSQ